MPEVYAIKGMEKAGKAYGFFDCRAQKKEIEAEIPTIRELVRTPLELYLCLIEGMDNVKGDPDLMSIAKDAKGHGIKYMLEATYPGATNRVTADEVGAVLNQAYQSPLYDDKETFRGAIVFEEDGKYLFRE